AGELADGPQLGCQRARQALDQTGGEKGADAKRGAKRADQAPQPDQGTDQRAVGRPAEPAENAPLFAVQRLHLAPGSARRIGVEAHIRKPGEVLDALERGFVELRNIAGTAAKIAERALERGVAIG